MAGRTAVARTRQSASKTAVISESGDAWAVYGHTRLAWRSWSRVPLVPPETVPAATAHQLCPALESRADIKMAEEFRDTPAEGAGRDPQAPAGRLVCLPGHQGFDDRKQIAGCVRRKHLPKVPSGTAESRRTRRRTIRAPPPPLP